MAKSKETAEGAASASSGETDPFNPAAAPSNPYVSQSVNYVGPTLKERVAAAGDVLPGVQRPGQGQGDAEEGEGAAGAPDQDDGQSEPLMDEQDFAGMDI